MPTPGSANFLTGERKVKATPPAALGGRTLPQDYPPGALLQPAPPAAASCAAPGPQPPPPPPQSLAFLAQPPAPPQPLGPAGAQRKKKSGFQITSVTPAQISASLSSNNSVAEDTESYDDLDESHTEDLSSSEILDASLSRATDLGEPERSSSEETLSNFQEAESPGAVSPNQPRPLPPPQHPPGPHPAQPPGAAVNGGFHPPHGHPFHPHYHGQHHAPHAGPPASPSFRRLSAPGSPDSLAAVPAGPSSAAPPFRPVSSAPGVPSARGVAASGVGSGPAGHAAKTLGSIPGTAGPAPLPGMGSGTGALGGLGSGTGASSGLASSAGNAAVAAPSSHLQPTAGTSRFRVVKLDCSSEPFRKGRWTCTEFYDKDPPAVPTDGVAVNRAVDALKQAPHEPVSERESNSGSSVSSSISTPSHYAESAGSGEGAAPALGPPQMDPGAAGPLPAPAPGVPQSISQPQLAQGPLHLQEAGYPSQKPGAQAAASAVPPPVSLGAGPPAPGLATVLPPQLPFAPVPPPPVQMAPVPPQALPYGPGQGQHAVAPSQQGPGPTAPGHAKPVGQSSVTGPGPDCLPPTLHGPAALATGPTGAGGGEPGHVTQGQSMQPSVQAQLVAAPSLPLAAVAPGTAVLSMGQQGGAAPMGQPPPTPGPLAPPVMVQSAGPSPSQGAPPTAPGMVPPGPPSGAAGLPQPLAIVPQSSLLPGQAAEPLVQAMAGQQLPPVSPVPAVSAAPVPGHSAASVPPAPMSLAPSKSTAPSSGAQNGSLVQSAPQPAPTAAPSVAQQGLPNSAPLSMQALAQPASARGEDARRATEPTVISLPPSAGSESGAGASSGGLSVAPSLLPLKALPLTAQLVDGEDERLKLPTLCTWVEVTLQEPANFP
ncbi:TSC22 domain family protein 1-like [Varanus komodoensis]|uniref:TSC22 domain family protein 1-like n=1 Tax=Varanus komodoensis TaxID=61221 RepID=UPI001CF7CBE9|nr:TSC22 domain family protein 1-like [Varanus komodoensis]